MALQNQMRIQAIRLLFAHSLGTDLRGVSNPQLEVQLRQQPFKPARVPLASIPTRTFIPWATRSTLPERERFVEGAKLVRSFEVRAGKSILIITTVSPEPSDIL